jgi:predicted PurR-regulated permease PerM
LPAALVLSMAAIQGASLFQNFNLSVKVGLEKLRSNSLLNLEFPYAKQVQGIQETVDHVQLQVASQQSYEQLTDKKGWLRSDVQKIRLSLDELIPLLVDASRDSTSKHLAKDRNKSNPKAKKIEKLDVDLEPYFHAAGKDLELLLAAQSQLSDDRFRAELERVRTDKPKQQSDMPADDYAAYEKERAAYEDIRRETFAKLSANEIATLEEARRTLLSNGIEWQKAITDVKKPLEELIPPEPGEAINDMNVAQLQQAVMQLANQWRKTRETISGGPWLSVLKELANPPDSDLQQLNDGFLAYLKPRLMTFTTDGATFLLRFMIASSILLLSLYFFLYDGPGMVRTIMELSPLDDRYELELLAEFDRISRAIVLATVLSALLQGLVAGIGYYFAGMPSLILLTALTATCALVPFVGPAIIWVPVCIYLAIYEEKLYTAGLLALWGMFVVGTVDNLVKVFVLHGQSQLHPLLALLSVLGGIQSLGPIGILVGPMVVVLLQTLLGILRTELAHFRKSEESTLATEAGSVPTENSSLSDLIRKVKGNGTGEAGAAAVAGATGEPPAEPSPT